MWDAGGQMVIGVMSVAGLAGRCVVLRGYIQCGCYSWFSQHVIFINYFHSKSLSVRKDARTKDAE